MIQLKRPTSEDETIYISDEKIISDHTKDGKTSFDSADAGNRKKKPINDGEEIQSL